MPGIAGFITSDGARPPIPEYLDRLRTTLTHESFYTSKPFLSGSGAGALLVAPQLDAPILGHATDPASGRTLAYYGEFYNPELRNLRDGAALAEGLLALHGKHGDRLPAELDGSFVLCIWEPERRRLLLATDHYASRPVFYRHTPELFAFAPEIKAIAQLAKTPLAIDRGALATFLIHGHLLGDQTYYQDVRPLPPATTLVLERGELQLFRSFDYRLHGDSPDRGERHYISTLSGLLVGAVEKRLRHTRQTVIPISGGYDSRGILACARQLTADRLTTVSWGINETEPMSDAWIGRRVANAVGTEHHFMVRESRTYAHDAAEMTERLDALTDDAVLHPHELHIMRRLRAELGSQHLMRGDECFGYGEPADSDAEALARIGIYEFGTFSDLPGLFPADVYEQLRGQSDATQRAILGDAPAGACSDRKDYWYWRQRLYHYLNRSTYYKLSVLDVQNPWLDKDILRFYQTVPVRYRINKSLYRATLAQLAPELQAIPMATHHSLESWADVIRHNAPLQRFLREQLLTGSSPLDGFVNRAAIERVLHALLQPAAQTDGMQRPSLTDRAKQLLQRAPWLYRLIKRAAMRHARHRHIEPEALLLRLLSLKLWLDRHA